MMEVLKQFKMLEKPKAGFIFDFDIAGATFRVRLIEVSKLRKYIEFVPEFEFVLRIKGEDWRDERIEIYRKGDLYLLLHIPRNAGGVIDLPFILVEKKIVKKYGTIMWEPIAYLYYYYFKYDGIYLTVRESVEFIIEKAIRENWEIKLLNF